MGPYEFLGLLSVILGTFMGTVHDQTNWPSSRNV